jgi:hypothetical protein
MLSGNSKNNCCQREVIIDVSQRSSSYCHCYNTPIIKQHYWILSRHKLMHSSTEPPKKTEIAAGTNVRMNVEWGYRNLKLLPRKGLKKWRRGDSKEHSEVVRPDNHDT